MEAHPCQTEDKQGRVKGAHSLQGRSHPQQQFSDEQFDATVRQKHDSPSASSRLVAELSKFVMLHCKTTHPGGIARITESEPYLLWVGLSEMHISFTVYHFHYSIGDILKRRKLFGELK